MSQLRPDHFEYVRTMVRERSGIVLEDGKEYLVEARMASLARAHKSDIDAIIEQARKSPSASMNDEIVDAMTTNETSFFRDIHPFNTLRETILPRLIEERASTRRLRLLSGASSTGQEAYSIAMLIRHHFPEIASWDIKITGTDISKEALAKAEAGQYTQLEINRGLPATLLRYFEQEGRFFRLDNSIRSMVDFKELNLVGLWPPIETQDIVLMRNVLIYFDTPTKQEILGKIRRILPPDGLLILGASETTLNLDDNYQSVRLGQTTVYSLDHARSELWSSPTMISAN